MRRNPRFGLLAGTAMNMRMFGGMTVNERRLGRFIRDGEGHPAPAPAAAEPAPAPSVAESDDFSAFESSLEPAPTPDSGTVAEPAPADTDDGGPGAPPEPEPQGASDQQSIDDLRADYQRQLEERDRELERLRQEREKPAEPPKEQQERKVGDAPNPDDYEFGEADSKYIADLAIYHADRRFEQREAQAQLMREVEEIETGWKTRTGSEEFKAKYPDFEEKVTRGADRGAWDCSPVAAVVLKSSEVGGDVAYHLATNPAESKRIAALPPMEQVRELGRLEGRFMTEAKPKVAAPTVTQAPPPPESRARGAGGRFAVPADTDDFAAFDAMADGVLTKKK